MQTQTKHTPGPWTTNRTSDTSEGRSIGTAKGSIALLTEDRYTASEQTANARIIAAAPDLLAAAERVARLMEWKDTPSSMVEIDAVKAQLRSAIARARGEGAK